MGQANNRHKYESDTFDDSTPNPSIEQMPLPFSNDRDNKLPSSKIVSSPVDERILLENQASSTSTKNIFSGVLGEHKLGGWVNAIAYHPNPDRKTIAVGTDDKKVTLIDSVTMKV
eukprot:CAMPEP_0198258098 /NCGR_PEP_ID=MMETSP1447-20131203/7616_1 /TAXON_ID=420782 /ORGANISM="Chaetoceros dichaeta, Strain CCMP1751" /LENGTH=114 /DNA_ID=CAMNT_0043945151 /DNA_START=233 /DNA_END=573 /DNA_ORIENTATION=+